MMANNSNNTCQLSLLLPFQCWAFLASRSTPTGVLVPKGINNALHVLGFIACKVEY